jgi:CHAD domain-containing protein
MAKAWEVPGLKRRSRFRDAAGRVILTRWREMMSYRDGTLLGEDIEELHAMRVSSRRLRAAMDAFEAAFPRRPYRARLRWVKRITDTLGAARDYDVAIVHLEAELQEAPEEERAGIAGLIERYRTERAGESAAIAALFDELEREDFGPAFERWVAAHTGVSMDALDPRPPAAD